MEICQQMVAVSTIFQIKLFKNNLNKLKKIHIIFIIYLLLLFYFIIFIIILFYYIYYYFILLYLLLFFLNNKIIQIIFNDLKIFYKFWNDF